MGWLWLEIGSVSKHCMESRSMSHQKPACVKTEKLLRETHTKERSRRHKPEALKQPQDEGCSDSETVLVPVAQPYPYPHSWMAEYPGERKWMDCSLTSVKHKGNGLLGCLYQSVMGRGWSSLFWLTHTHIYPCHTQSASSFDNTVAPSIRGVSSGRKQRPWRPLRDALSATHRQLTARSSVLVLPGTAALQSVNFLLSIKATPSGTSRNMQSGGRWLRTKNVWVATEDNLSFTYQVLNKWISMGYVRSDFSSSQNQAFQENDSLREDLQRFIIIIVNIIERMYLQSNVYKYRCIRKTWDNRLA